MVAKSTIFGTIYILNRNSYKKLLNWKTSPARKPLIMRGARQVGKTHLIKEFGQNEFTHCHYFNFETDRSLHEVFLKDFFVDRILDELSLKIRLNIDPEKDIIILDEIQECPRALTALKYFCEDKPDLAVLCAGSLLGVKLSHESFPVGKVDFMDLFPMTFSEFLMALDDQHALKALDQGISRLEISTTAHNLLWERLKEYYFVGGMPEIVGIYTKSDLPSFQKNELVRKAQRNLIDSYHKDFAKHSGKVNSMQIVSVFENAPLQLSKNRDDSVKRYHFKEVLPNKRGFSQLQGPVDWLVQAGLLIKIKIANRAELPLDAFCRENIFKLFIFDVGILACMLDLPVETLVDDDYGITKGYFSENFAATQFLASDFYQLHAWQERSSEIEFLQRFENQLVPIEVKSGKNTQAKSLQQYLTKYSPDLAIMVTGKALQINSTQVVQKIPLYMVESLREIVQNVKKSRLLKS